ncbi:hypothetical protein ACBR40_42595 [Nonomuraea sp. AD125B]
MRGEAGPRRICHSAHALSRPIAAARSRTPSSCGQTTVVATKVNHRPSSYQAATATAVR